MFIQSTETHSKIQRVGEQTVFGGYGRGKDVAVISLVSKSWKLKNKFRSEEQRNVTCFGSFKQEVE